MWKSARVGPATCRWSITSPCSLRSGLWRSIASRSRALPAASASTLSSACPKRGMPALNDWMGTPSRRPLPAMVKPSASKRMSASTCSMAGHSGWNFSLPPCMRASTRNLPAPARPLSVRNGQSSRSPLTTACTSRKVPPRSAALSQSTVVFDIRWWTQNPGAIETGASPISTARSSRGRVPSSWKPMPPRAFTPSCSPRIASPGVRTVQPPPSRQATTSPSRLTSCTTPNPAGQSKAAVARGSRLRRTPSASPCSTASMPRMPGLLPTGAKCRPRRRASTRRGPPRTPAMSTSSSTAPAADACSHCRSPGGTRSLKASKASNGVASIFCARRPNCWPPATAMPSSTCRCSPSPIRSRAACACHWRMLPAQRASRLTLPNSTTGTRAAPGTAAPRSTTPSSPASACTPTTRFACKSAQPCTRPRPETSPMPATCRVSANWRKSTLRAPAYTRPSPLARSKSSAMANGVASMRAHACAPTRMRGPSTRMRRSMRGRVMSSSNSGAFTCRRACDTCNSPNRSRVVNGSPPACCCPGRPRTLQRPAGSRCRVRSNPRTRSSVNERPGSRPAYCATSISASPMRSGLASSPMRRLSSRSNGPRRVHSVSTASNATGRCARALSQRAISSGWRSATGSNWLAMPLATAISTSDPARAYRAPRRNRRQRRRGGMAWAWDSVNGVHRGKPADQSSTTSNCS